MAKSKTEKKQHFTRATKDHCSTQGRKVQKGHKRTSLASNKCQKKGPAHHWRHTAQFESSWSICASKHRAHWWCPHVRITKQRSIQSLGGVHRQIGHVMSLLSSAHMLRNWLDRWRLAVSFSSVINRFSPAKCICNRSDLRRGGIMYINVEIYKTLKTNPSLKIKACFSRRKSSNPHWSVSVPMKWLPVRVVVRRYCMTVSL